MEGRVKHHPCMVPLLTRTERHERQDNIPSATQWVAHVANGSPNGPHLFPHESPGTPVECCSLSSRGLSSLVFSALRHISAITAEMHSPSRKGCTYEAWQKEAFTT